MDETFHSSSLVIPYLDTRSMSVKICFFIVFSDPVETCFFIALFPSVIIVESIFISCDELLFPDM